MKRFAALAAALCLGLAGCQSPAEAAPSEPEPEVPALAPGPGVEVKTLLTWEPGSRRVLVPFPAREDRLLVEVHVQTGQWTEVQLAGFDLTTGEEGYFARVAKFDGFEYRQPLDVPGWEVKIFHGVSYQHDSWTGTLGGYTLPESLWEGRRTYSGRHDWDAWPERDLLVWTTPEGLWLAAADGSGARLVLAVGEVAKQPDFAFLEGEAALALQCPRLMNGGRTVVVDFDLPGSPTGHIGLAVLEIETGKAFWYAPFANPLWGGLEYLDDTTVQAGHLQIDVVTGEAREVSRHIQAGGPYFVATTGDFSRYFACDTEAGLAVLSPEGGREPETVLTAMGYRELSLCHAVDGRRVICEYEKPGEAGLLLVTLPD